MYRLYIKLPEQTRFAPVDWNAGLQVINLIYASIFTSEEVETLKRVELAHPDNAHIEWEFRKVDAGGNNSSK